MLYVLRLGQWSQDKLNSIRESQCIGSTHEWLRKWERKNKFKKKDAEEDGIIKKSKIELRLKHIREVIGLMNEKWLRKIDI